MFSYIKGELAAIYPDSIVVENSGIGFLIYTSLNAIGELPPIGEDVKIYTYMAVKEDDISLIGFVEEADIDMFKKLISVSGIGTKSALAILSELKTDELVTAIMSGDAKAISAANGVGKKSAERVILELKDKINLEDMYISDGSNGVHVSDSSDNIKDAILAMTSLGINSSDAAKAVRKVEGRDAMTAEEILKAALKNI